EREARTRIDADRVLDEVAFIAFSDIRDIEFAPDGRLISRTPGAARAVASYSWAKHPQRGGTAVSHAVRLWNKLKALEMLMKHFGLLNRPITLETVLGVLPPDVRAILEKLLTASGHEVSGEKRHLT